MLSQNGQVECLMPIRWRFLFVFFCIPMLLVLVGCDSKKQNFPVPVATKVAQFNVSKDMENNCIWPPHHCELRDLFAANATWKNVEMFDNCTITSIKSRVAPVSGAYDGFYYVGHMWIPGCSFAGLWFKSGSQLAFTGAASYDFVFLNGCSSAKSPSIVAAAFNVPVVATNVAIGWDNITLERLCITAGRAFFNECNKTPPGTIDQAIAAANQAIETAYNVPSTKTLLDGYTELDTQCGTGGQIPKLTLIYGPGNRPL